jgi:hypothetical protein
MINANFILKKNMSHRARNNSLKFAFKVRVFQYDDDLCHCTSTKEKYVAPNGEQRFLNASLLARRSAFITVLRVEHIIHGAALG